MHACERPLIYLQCFRSYLKTHHFPHPVKWKPHSFILARILRPLGLWLVFLQTAAPCLSHSCDMLSKAVRTSPQKQAVNIPWHSVPSPCDFPSKFAFVLSVGKLHRMTIDATSERSFDGNEGWGRSRLIN